MIFRLLVSALAVLSAGAAHAEDICQAVALRDAPSSGGSYVVPKGGYVTAITQYQIDPDTKERSFCTHGGGCYPERVTIAGRGEVTVLRLTNCIIGPRIDDGVYSVIVDRRRNSAAVLRRDDVENQLMDFGMCSACADNAAEHYTTNPGGNCARMVKGALEGNPELRLRLANNPEVCRYRYPDRSVRKQRR